MAIVFQNVLSGEQVTTTDLEETLYYMQNESVWELLPLPVPTP